MSTAVETLRRAAERLHEKWWASVDQFDWDDAGQQGTFKRERQYNLAVADWLEFTAGYITHSGKGDEHANTFHREALRVARAVLGEEAVSHD